MINPCPKNPDPNKWAEPEVASWTVTTVDLLACGLLEDDALEWEQAGLPATQHLVTQALAADREGLSPATFTNWCLRGGWQADEATAFITAGYTKAQAEFIRYLLFLRGLFGREGSGDKSYDWLASPLSPEWTCRALANGALTVSQGTDLFQASFHDRQLAGRLDLIGVLCGANNRELVIDHEEFIKHLRRSTAG